MAKGCWRSPLGPRSCRPAGSTWREAHAADLRGQVVLSTGSSRGLGLTLAREFGQLGCRLVICARDGDELPRARAALEEPGVEVLADVCDVSDRAAIQALVAAATRRFGRIDVLVNNVGVISVGPLDDAERRCHPEGDDSFRFSLLAQPDDLHAALAHLSATPESPVHTQARLLGIGHCGGRHHW